MEVSHDIERKICQKFDGQARCITEMVQSIGGNHLHVFAKFHERFLSKLCGIQEIENFDVFSQSITKVVRRFIDTIAQY